MRGPDVHDPFHERAPRAPRPEETLSAASARFDASPCQIGNSVGAFL